MYAFIDLNMDADKKIIANHFMMEGHLKSIIYDIIKRREDKIQAERKVGSCRQEHEPKGSQAFNCVRAVVFCP